MKAWEALKKAIKPVDYLKVQQAFLLLLYSAILFVLFPSLVQAVPPGTVISNTATANFDVSGSAQNTNSNLVDITTTVIFTDATLEIFQFS